MEENLVKSNIDLLKERGTKWLNFTEFAHYLSVSPTEPSLLELFKVISKVIDLFLAIMNQICS